MLEDNIRHLLQLHIPEKLNTWISYQSLQGCAIRGDNDDSGSTFTQLSKFQERRQSTE